MPAARLTEHCLMGWEKGLGRADRIRGRLLFMGEDGRKTKNTIDFSGQIWLTDRVSMTRKNID